MDAVGLVQGALARNALDQVGIERHAVGLGEARENGIEVARVAAAHLRRRGNARQQDRNPAGFQLPDDAVEVGAGAFGSQPLQQVVAPLGPDGQISVLLHAEIDASQTSGGGVAADTGRAHHIGDAQSGQGEM